MLNTGKLAGKTIFITGASRGIGLAIALKCAADGANIIVAAKTADPHPKLPGTIFTAAAEIEKRGGKSLACVVDVRDEAQVQQAVEKAVEKFGSIDVLINNASAIHLTGTLETPMKRYDLMHGINTRGTYMVSQKCIPYLKQAKNPHILNISPPLNMNPRWFKNHVAYTMAKYGMSMCVLGMAEELRPSNIAVNALWPKTAILTAAMEMLGGKDVSQYCRKPEIMADAAYVMLTRDSRNFTGNFSVDEDVLKSVGVENFDGYAVAPGNPLLPDFFLDGVDPEKFAATMESGGASPRFKGGKEQKETKSEGQSGASHGGQVGKIFEGIRTLLSSELVSKTKGIYQFHLTGDEKGTWFVDLKNGSGSCGQGESKEKAEVTMTLDTNDFVKMFTGQMKPTAAFMSGKLKIKGDMGLAIKLEKLMGQMKAKL